MRIPLTCLVFLFPLVAGAAPAGLSPDHQMMSAERISPVVLEAQAAFGSPVPRGPLYVARAVEYQIDSDTTGSWEQLADQRWVWRAVVRADQAASVGVTLTRTHLLDDATIHAYAPDGSRVHQLMTLGDSLTSPLIGGDTLIVEALLPANRGRGRIEIQRLDYGFTDPATGRSQQKSGACNVDVVCQEGDAWRDEIRSVARYTFTTLLGTALCTGSLVNNVAADRRPLFLTANHCVSSESAANSMTVYWNYETSSCGGTPNGSLNQSQSGASLLATGEDSDFTLVELDATPNEAFGVYYAGWDATGAVPQAVTAIHHPSGDEKRISFENDPLTQTAYSSDTPDPSAQFWRISDWDLGTTEGGSSGSGIWDNARRIVGQLSGGAAACGNDDPDWYGRFSDNWSNGSATNSLQPHLDPSNTGTLAVDGLDSPSGSSGGGSGGGGSGGGNSGGSNSGGGSGAHGGWMLASLLSLAGLRRRR